MNEPVRVKGWNTGNILRATTIDRHALVVPLERKDQWIGRESGELRLVLVEEMKLVLMDTDRKSVKHQVARVVDHTLGTLLEPDGLGDVHFGWLRSSRGHGDLCWVVGRRRSWLDKEGRRTRKTRVGEKEMKSKKKE
jgi:hypothetical protein